jgi:hypothetical protein
MERNVKVIIEDKMKESHCITTDNVSLTDKIWSACRENSLRWPEKQRQLNVSVSSF